MKNILAALMFFTRLPFWRIATVEKEYFKNVVNYWPYAGIVTGAVGAGVMLGASYLFPVTVAVILGLVARVLVTGALHEDGLADFFDGFGGGTSKEATLRIMKDSHIGSYGVLALILYFALMVALLSSLPVKAAALLFFCGDILCKGVAGNMVNMLPYARTEEESKNKLVYNKIPAGAYMANVGLVLLVLGVAFTLYLPLQLYVAVFVPFVVMWALARYMKKKIQGYTGDCCGAMFLLCELSFLMAAVAVVNLM